LSEVATKKFNITLAAIHLFLHCVLKPALKCSLLQEVGDFEAKSFVLIINRQFLVAGFMS